MNAATGNPGTSELSSTPHVSFIQIWKSSLTTPPARHQFQTPAEKVILAASRTH